jgi:branched-chain amino acid transport system permease protein
VSEAWQFYISTLLVYLGVTVMACWGLNLQFGVAGLLNFAFIIFQAIGAYAAALVTIGPHEPDSFQSYIFGTHWPFPLPILAGAAAGGILALIVGLIALRRLRSDYQAVVMLVISLIASAIATNAVGLFNGAPGLSLIPKPLASTLDLSIVGYQWFYVGLTAACCLIVYVITTRIQSSPFGRSLRAVRDNPDAVAALGKNVATLRIRAFVIGGAIAGASGALLASFIGAWSPASWDYRETFVLFTAILVGGTGNMLGVALGALLVPIAFLEATRFIPSFGRAGLVEALQWVIIGAVTLLFLWFWPRGLLSERKRTYSVPEA